MKILQFLKTKLFWLNVAAAIIIFIIVVSITMGWLGSYTLHGETITVPNLKGMNLAQVQQVLKSKNLEFAIWDSLYDKNMKPAAVLDQNPKPNTKVKHNRTIYITLNAYNPPKFKMPRLIDKSLRQAQMEMESYGLKIGKLTYVPDLAQNAVLKQLVNGKEIEAGEMVTRGTVIDLILGDGLGNTQVEIPFLLNLTLSEAKFVLTASSLNLGAVIFSGSSNDSSAAIVYKQFPKAVSGEMINMGESIDLFVASEFPDSLKYLLNERPETNVPDINVDEP